VLIKGGHLPQPTDVLWDGERYKLYEGKRVAGGTHGSGCTGSALIASYLALGLGVEKSIAQAKETVTRAIRFSYKPGKGVGVVNQTFPVVNALAMGEVIKRLRESLSSLSVPLSLFPEVGINFVYALPYPSSIEDVLGVRGRIRVVGNEIRKGCLEFGGSKHVASIVLTAMSFDPKIRSVLNIGYTPHVVEICRRLGFSVGSFDRREEPAGKSTMEWGTATAIRSMKQVPDVVYDEGAIGKEPMVRILGTDPEDVAKKLEKIVGALGAEPSYSLP